ncbi:hypothetical protein [Limosilactobacillus coleohominis]|uniref:hypothetical protein n=1 Tax=Limosilactobacillus coleohominis TaxID=181675 RepID=UPI0026EFC55F|nr:hypothetical protein [Limosilactobacillus coleohominis]
MTKEEKLEIAKMAAEILRKDSEPKVTTEWRQLSREISEYCKKQSEDYDQPAYVTIQNAIYNPIRYILGVHKVNTLRGKEVDKAREIFEFIKHQREEVES